MKVVVTGGAGFIGTRLMMHLRQQPWITSVLGLDSNGYGAGVIKADVRDAAAVDQAVKRAHAVVHLAALISAPDSLNRPTEYMDVNSQGTAVVAEACRRHGAHLVLASSAAVYGAADTPVAENAPYHPNTPYAASKMAAEAIVRGLQTDGGLSATVLRLFNVYGPGQNADHPYASVVPKFISAALVGEPMILYRRGGATRDFVHVDDVAELIGQVIKNRVESLGPFNVGTGVETPIGELARLVTEQATAHGASRWEIQEAENARPGDVWYSGADTTRTGRLFPGWQPRPLASGLAETYEWYLKAQTSKEALPWLTR